MKRVSIIVCLVCLVLSGGFSEENGRSAFSIEIKGLRADLNEEERAEESLKFIHVTLNYELVSDNNLSEKFYIEICNGDNQSVALNEDIFLVLTSQPNNNAYYPGHSFMNSGEFVFTEEDSIKIYNFIKNNTEIHMVLQTQSTKRVFLFSLDEHSFSL